MLNGRYLGPGIRAPPARTTAVGRFLPLKYKSPDVRFAAVSGLGEPLTRKEWHPQESANRYLLGLIAFRKRGGTYNMTEQEQQTPGIRLMPPLVYAVSLFIGLAIEQSPALPWSPSGTPDPMRAAALV